MSIKDSSVDSIITVSAIASNQIGYVSVNGTFKLKLTRPQIDISGSNGLGIETTVYVPSAISYSMAMLRVDKSGSLIQLRVESTHGFLMSRSKE